MGSDRSKGWSSWLGMRCYGDGVTSWLCSTVQASTIKIIYYVFHVAS